MIAVTRWSYEQIAAMTMPQLELTLEGAGRMRYAQLEPMIQANLSNLSAEPGAKGAPSSAEEVIRHWEDRKAGIPLIQSAKERTLERARRILLSPYLGDPDAAQEQPAQSAATFPGMGVDEAQAWVAWVKADKCPDAVWLEICDAYPAIFNTAKAEGPR